MLCPALSARLVAHESFPFDLLETASQPGHCFWDAGPRVGLFIIKGSHAVHLQPAQDLDPASLQFALSHNVLAALHRHRGDLVLHANTLDWHGSLIAIAGPSGAGKSTTAAGLIQRGASLVADDLTVLRAGHHDQLLVRPGPPELHLTRDVAERLGLSKGARPSPVRATKVIVPLADTPAVAAGLPSGMPPWQPDPHGPGLRDLVLLSADDTPLVRLNRLRGHELFLALQHCIYGPLRPCDTPASFRLQALLARQVRVWSLSRPREAWCLDALLDTLAEALTADPPIGQDSVVRRGSSPPTADG